MTIAVVLSPLFVSLMATASICSRRPARRIIVTSVAPTKPPVAKHWQRWWPRIGCCIALVLSPALAGVLGAGWYCVSIARRRRSARLVSREQVNGLAEVIDLFALTITSGGTVLRAIEQLGNWAPTPYALPFQWCARQIELGRPLADMLEELPQQLGEGVRPLVAALVAHDRYGAPIGSHLVRLASDARADRRRRAQAVARRLPVTMLFPLVLCVLPAFLLLTVVPVVAETMGDFDFLASP